MQLTYVTVSRMQQQPYTLKKAFGQHFLKDQNIINKIIAALQENQFTNLLEVGPGGGALTQFISTIPGINFKAIEIDKEKVEYLSATFPHLQGKIIHQDFLKSEVPFEERFTIIGNFPYNISSQILFKTIDWRLQIDHIIGMFQKEVAQRIASKPGNKVYGVISVLIQAFYDVEYLFDVPPGCFNPPPKVMSGVIRLTPKKEPIHGAGEKQMKMLVKMAFNQRRKQLRNAVKSLFTEEMLKDEIFNKRAEQLSIEDFAALTYKIGK